MVFKETSIFTKQITALIDDDEYKEIQQSLLMNPEQGPVIPHSGGIRKLRQPLGTHGKRGGFRLIYYWHVAHDTFLMLLAYPKNVQDNLTDAQLKMLRNIVESELNKKP